jgi:hypothetical protein
MDYTRLSKHMKSEDLVNFTPGSVYLVESDMMPQQGPAVRPFVVPSNIGDYVRLMEHFMEMAHSVTNIPAALHGTAVGTGANRTFRGMATLQSNAVKSIQAAVGNIDEGIFLPMGRLLYAYNMLYEDDPSIKGDCKVYAQGVTGLLDQEIKRQNATELLQILGAVASQMGDSAGPVVTWAIRNILGSMGVPPEIAAKVEVGGGEGPPGTGPEGMPPGMPQGMPPGMPQGLPPGVPPELAAAIAAGGAGVPPGPPMPPDLPMPPGTVPAPSGAPMLPPAPPDTLPPFPDAP